MMKRCFFVLIFTVIIFAGCDDYQDSADLNTEEQLAMIYRHGELRAAEKLNDGSIDEYGEYFVFDNITGIIQIEDEKMILSFFGSDDVLDWIANLHFLQVKTPFDGAASDSRIHLGFLYSYNDIKDFCMERITEYIDEGNNRLIIAGHSFGAALATLLSCDIALSGEDVVLTTFVSGSPRVGNQSFADDFDSLVPSCYRYVNRDDLVPMIPTEEMGYRHVGEFHHIGEDPDLNRQALLLGIEDHFIEKYVESLDQGLY